VVVIDGADITYKHDKQLDKFINDFINAWRKCGGVHEDQPFLDRQLWKNYLMGEEDKSQRNAEEMLQVSEDNRMVGRLVKDNIIQPFGSGFIVIDGALLSSLMISRNFGREEE
jgi:hypothetical protein